MRHRHAADSRRIALVGKGAIAFVPVKEFGHGVIGNKDVEMAVPIVIGESDAQSLAWLREACFLRNFSKVAIAIVVIYQWRNRAVCVRMAVRAVAFSSLAAPGIVKVPLQVSKYN